MIEEIPFFPNNRGTKQNLSDQALLPVLLHYLSWKCRTIPQRPRKTYVEKYALDDKRMSGLESRINNLLSEVEAGNDLTLYLSSKVNCEGYTPYQNTNGDKWADKDFLLNTTGFHHFHLAKYPNRTNEVVFARVTREAFHIIAIFDHSVFDSVATNNDLSQERSRLLELHSEYSSRGLPPGTVYASSILVTSGHPLHVVDLASIYNEVIINNDPKLDDPDFISKIYCETQLQIPKKQKFSWYIHGLDLGIVDNNKQCIIYKFGPC